MNDPEKDIIIDGAMKEEEILAQNPENPAPQNILDSLEIIEVKYFGFDGRVHAGQIVMNRSIAREVESFFALALELRFPIEKVMPISNAKYRWNDEVSCGDNNSSGYNYRVILGTSRLSNHATGLAFDINPAQNIFIKYDKDMNEIYRVPKNGKYDKNISGTLTPENPLVGHMKNLGWKWGGDWKPEEGRADYQHFEKPPISRI